MWLLLAWAGSSSGLLCPPQCIGSNRSSVFLAARHECAFVGQVMGAVQTSSQKRVAGVAAEVDHLVAVQSALRGGIFLKRVGKNAVHVFSGLGLEPGSECSVSLSTREVYLFAGWARRGTSAAATALIDVNQCALAVPWSAVNADERAWLAQVLQARSDGRCPVALVASAAPPSCACAPGLVCQTNLFQSPASYCGPPRSWCLPAAEIAP